MTDNVAVLKGYTVEIEAENGQGLVLNLLVKPGTDYDDVFRAWDMNEQEFIRVNGWLFAIDEADYCVHPVGVSCEYCTPSNEQDR